MIFGEASLVVILLVAVLIGAGPETPRMMALGGSWSYCGQIHLIVNNTPSTRPMRRTDVSAIPIRADAVASASLHPARASAISSSVTTFESPSVQSGTTSPARVLHPRVDVDAVARAQRAAQRRVIRHPHRIFARRAHAEVFIHARVIARKILEGSVAQAVAPRVADVRDAEAAGFGMYGNEGRPHAPLSWNDGRGLGADARMSALHRGDEEGAGIADRAGSVGGQGSRRLGIEALHGFDGESGGDLAVGVAPHSIGDDEQAQRITDSERVLVDLARATLLAATGGFEGDRRRRQGSSLAARRGAVEQWCVATVVAVAERESAVGAGEIDHLVGPHGGEQLG
jgi:hypothetical protein